MPNSDHLSHSVSIESVPQLSFEWFVQVAETDKKELALGENQIQMLISHD
jgi:hypothetical protein